MSEWKFRLAEPTDAAAFSEWAGRNPLIDPKDLEASRTEKNPTVVFFAVEDDHGKVIAFAPIYCMMMLAHLGFNPDSSGEERKKAMQMLLDGAIAFAVQFGIREIGTLSKEEYPVARWGMKHGFDLEPRQFFKFDINKILEVAKDNPLCALALDKSKLMPQN